MLELILSKKALVDLDREALTKKQIHAPKLKFYNGMQDARYISTLAKRCYVGIVNGIKNIMMWNPLKREMKKYFYPENMEFEAYRKLQRLDHDGH